VTVVSEYREMSLLLPPRQSVEAIEAPNQLPERRQNTSIGLCFATPQRSRSHLTFDHCYSVNLQQVSRQPIGKPTTPTASPKRAVKSIEKPRICASETYIHVHDTYILGGAAQPSNPVFRKLGSCKSAFLSERIPHHARPSTARLRLEPGVPHARLVLV
jgi:hypothetical protein